jgi:hypothetical protein
VTVKNPQRDGRTGVGARERDVTREELVDRVQDQGAAHRKAYAAARR